MNYLLIVAVLMALIGTVYWLQPSPRQRHLSKLREQARVLGLKLMFKTLEIESKNTGLYEKRSGVFYCLNKKEATSAGELLFEIVKEKGWYQDNLPNEYSWHKQPMTQNCFSEKDFKDALNLLNDELLVLSVYENQIRMLCGEQTQAEANNYVEFLKFWLDDHSQKTAHQ